MASLKGVVDEWDDSQIVRQRIREQGKLLVPVPTEADVRVNVECGEHNFEALKPLVRRLQDPPGQVGMHCVPHIEQMTLCWTHNMFEVFLF